jgi:hypothetical protein
MYSNEPCEHNAVFRCPTCGVTRNSSLYGVACSGETRGERCVDFATCIVCVRPHIHDMAYRPLCLKHLPKENVQ